MGVLAPALRRHRSGRPLQDLQQRLLDALAAYRRAFVDGAALTLDVLAQTADAVGLGGDELREAIANPQVKAALRATTEGAWSAGVKGVPTVRIAGAIFYGDDQLERAAAALNDA